MIGGDYATYLSAAWAPGYLQGAGVGEGADAGVWATAPMPQWDPANPVSINWGGSAFVGDQPGEATRSSRPRSRSGSTPTRRRWRTAGRTRSSSRSTSTCWTSPEFQDYEVPFFDGQQANKEVYVPAANAYTGMTYTPIGQYYYTALTKQIAAINDGSATGSEAADALQADVVAYAEEQGFTRQVT